MCLLWWRSVDQLHLQAPGGELWGGDAIYWPFKGNKEACRFIFRGLPTLLIFVHLFFSWAQRASCRQALSKLDHVATGEKVRHTDFVDSRS